MQRKAWRMIPKAGSIDNLKLIEEPIDEPKAHEIQVEVKSIGFNFADVFAMFGLYGATPNGSFVPGLEFSGVVTKAGKDVREVAIGQRVMGVTRFGGYATHINLDERYVKPMPGGWSFEQGAAYLVQALTAYYGLLELGNLKKGDTVLVHSAAGGVGIWANRIAKHFGAYTIGCVGNESKLKLLEEQGYDQGFVRNEKTFRQDLKKVLDGRRLNIVMECIGGKILMGSYLAMAPEGRLITYGSAHYAQPGAKPNYLKLIWTYYKRPMLDPQKMIEQNKSVMGFNLIYLYENLDRMYEILNKLMKLDLGEPYVGHTFKFDQLREAVSLFQTGKTTGKVVVTT